MVVKVRLCPCSGSLCAAAENGLWDVSGTAGAAQVCAAGAAPEGSGCSENEGEDLFHCCPARQVQRDKLQITNCVFEIHLQLCYAKGMFEGVSLAKLVPTQGRASFINTYTIGRPYSPVGLKAKGRDGLGMHCI